MVNVNQTTGIEPHAQLRVLTVTTLYPNRAQPSHGIFVESRLRQLVATGSVEASVLAPVPWFPLQQPMFGRYARYATVPRFEVRHGISVAHPCYLAIPKVGAAVAPLLLGIALLRELRALAAAGRSFDLIDAHYFYPDGVAAAWVAHRVGMPVVITARGTDLSHFVPHHPAARQMIKRAAHRADGLVTVCQALKDVLVDLGIPETRVRVLRNGVDLDLFRPLERSVIRRDLGLSRPTLLCVGHLIERKGVDVAIGALAQIPDADLLIVGEGPERQALKALADRIGVAGRARFLGPVVHEELPRIYNAADALILASSREGWANVLLEAMACGTPVIASRVWGTPEVVGAPAAGILVDDRTPPAFAAAACRLFAEQPDRAATRAYAERFSWDATTQGQLALFRSVIAQSTRRRMGPAA